MGEEMTVSFPGNLKVHAHINDTTIETDQPEKSGGDGTATSPFSLFTASLATCTGYFALKFCRSRNLATDGMSVTMKYEWDDKENRYSQMIIKLQLPQGFPEKYRGAIVKAMDQCVVKKHILNPPEISIHAV